MKKKSTLKKGPVNNTLLLSGEKTKIKNFRSKKNSIEGVDLKEEK